MSDKKTAHAGNVFGIALLGAATAVTAGACLGEPGGSESAPPPLDPRGASSAAALRVAEIQRAHATRVVEGDGLSPAGTRLEPVLAPGVAVAFTAPAGAPARLVPSFPDAERRATGRPARVELPLVASAPTRVVDEVSGLSVAFGLRGARPAAVALHDGLALYPAATADGMDVVHRPTPTGVEDYVILDHAPAEEVLRYDVDVSAAEGLRLVGNVLELVAGGAPVLRVAPPYVVGADHVKRMATLSVEGCAYDTRASGGRPLVPVPPGARACTLVVSWAPAVRHGCARGDGTDDCRPVVYPAVLDPAWTTTHQLHTARRYFGLADQSTISGTVLWAVGGNGGSGAVAAVETSTDAGAWVAEPDLPTARESPHVIASSDNQGDVIVAGGVGPAGTLATADRFRAGAWQGAGTMSGGARRDGRVIELDADTILLAGGNDGAGVFKSSTDVYKPSTNAWTAGPTMKVARTGFTFTRLTDGRYLAAGGLSAVGSPLKSAETYTPGGGGNPAAGTWTLLAGTLPQAVFRHSAVPFGNKVMIAGGATNIDSDTNRIIYADAAVFDPATNAFSPTSPMKSPREHFAMLSVAGRVIVAGGRSSNTTVLSSAEIFDGGSAWDNSLPPLALGRWLPGAYGSRVIGGTTSAGTTNTVESIGLDPLGTACSAAKAYLCQSAFCADGVCCESACSQAGSSCGANGLCRKDTGQTCTSVGQCLSGFCVDGTCCADACATPCKSCSNPTGTCTTNTPANAPDGACSGGSVCDGQGGCKKTNGQGCGGPGECLSGHCVDATCCADACDTACKSCANPSGTCTTDVPAGAPDGTCAGGSVCDGQGGCKKTNGQACGGPGECLSGVCIDGVCCNDACTGLCQACAAARKESGVDGECGPAKVGTDPHGTCPTASCTGDVSTTFTCDAAGTCNQKAVVDCAPAKCDKGVCATACAEDEDCGDNAWCGPGSTCQPQTSLAVPCTDGRSCLSGFCADGLCCTSACGQGAGCQSCDAPGFEGTCIPCAGTVSCPDGHTLELADGSTKSCAPYLCDVGGTACRETCSDSTECVGGTVCDENGKCVEKTTLPEPEAGCGCRVAGDGAEAPPAWLLGALAALAMGRRRRRA